MEFYGDLTAFVLELPVQQSTPNYARKFSSAARVRAAGRTPRRVQARRGRLACGDRCARRRRPRRLDASARRASNCCPTAASRVIDLYAVVLPSDVPAAKQFWPIGDMSQKSMDWLDRGLVAGRIDGGRGAIHCDLDDWPNLDFAGQFKARVEISDLTLDYNPAWPRAEGVGVIAEFINSSMHAETSGGRVLGAQRRNARLPTSRHSRTPCSRSTSKARARAPICLRS